MKKNEKAQLLSMVEQYFAETEHEMKTQDMGDYLLVDVSYQDFRQTGRVRHDLKLLSPCIVVGDLDRYYSRYALKNAFGLMASQWLEARQISNGIPE